MRRHTSVLAVFLAGAALCAPRVPAVPATLGGAAAIAGAPMAGAAGTGDLGEDLVELLDLPVVAPPQQAAAVALLRGVLGPGVRTRVNARGDLKATLGAGRPRRLIVCPLGEPELKVTAIDDRGYLRLAAARPAARTGALWAEAHEGQLVWVMGARGPVAGAVVPRSIHFQGPAAGSRPFALGDAFADVGASGAAEAARLGVRLSDPVALDRRPVRLAHGLIAGPDAGLKGASLAAAAAARRLQERPGSGTAVFVWTMSRSGAAPPPRSDGPFDAVIELGPGGPSAAGERRLPGAPVFTAMPPVHRPAVFGPRAVSYAPTRPTAPDARGAQRIQLRLPARFPGTPVETVAVADMERLEGALLTFLGSPAPAAGAARAPAAAPGRVPDPGRRGAPPALPRDLTLDPGAGLNGGRGPEEPPSDPAEAEVAALAAPLVAVAGVSGGESRVRDAIRRQLPAWTHSVVDRLGNLSVELAPAGGASVGGAPAGGASIGGAPAGGAPSAPRIFLAHMDEVGFRVQAMLPDGRLSVYSVGGLYPSLWEAQAALVQGRTGAVPAIFEPRAGWSSAITAEPAGLLDVWTGAYSAAEMAPLGIAARSMVTMPKRMLRLGLHRVVGRALDDRLGDAALLLALRRIDAARVRRRVVFAWTVREETAQTGAAFLARHLPAAESVFPVDAFVTADSPREARPPARVPLGSGAVLRTGPGSTALPAAVERIAALARRRGIPLSTAVSAGSTDGAPFAASAGAVLPLGWPDRYMHSPVEVADLRDVDALVRLIVALVYEP